MNTVKTADSDVCQHATFGRLYPLLTLLCLLLAVIVSVGCRQKTSSAKAPESWQTKLVNIKWAAYNPPWDAHLESASADGAVPYASDSLREDLSLLRKAGFSGLVTYSSSADWVRELPGVAHALGYRGVILGVWDPANTEELHMAQVLAQHECIVGLCVGNEGLAKRYSMETLKTAIASLSESTGKPVTTTEEIDDYVNPDLLSVGAWVFPNVHPYFHGQLDAVRAAEWTMAAYADISQRTDELVLFKEVGLPTSGDKEGTLSEDSQRDFFIHLERTAVKFVYFEAFDQPWKRHLPVEPHWGLFRSDRTPKRFAAAMLGVNVEGDSKVYPLYVYRDAGSVENHFTPTGYMGDLGDIVIDEAWTDKPYSGKTCIRVQYLAEGKGPSTADYPGPARWAGVYWQTPPNNWGTEVHAKGQGLDLSRYSKLVFFGRAEKPCKVEFKVGGISEKYGDSLRYPRVVRVSLRLEWQRFEISLENVDLSHIIGGFCWVTNQEESPGGVVFYLDDIQYEH